MIESKKYEREIFSKKNYLFLIILFSNTIIFSQNTTGLIQKKKKILEEIELTSQMLQSAKKQKKLSIQSLRALTLNIKLRTELREMIIQQKDSIGFYKKEIESEIQTTERERKNLIEEYKKLIILTYFNEFETGLLYFIFSENSFKEALNKYIYYKNQESLRKQLIKNLDIITKELLQFKNTLDTNMLFKEALLGEIKTENDSLVVLKYEQEKLSKELAKKENFLIQDINQKETQVKQVESEILMIQKENSGKNLDLDKQRMAFEKKKGELIWPVEKGVLMGKYGTVLHKKLPGIRVVNNGIEIGVNKNSNARAVFEGVVSKIFIMPNGLKALIVRHGTYFTVYSNLEKTYIQAESVVLEGQKLGLIFCGTNEKAGILGFQIWKGLEKTNPIQINPMNWIKNNK